MGWKQTRGLGPLDGHVDGFRAALMGLGYSPGSGYRLSRVLTHLSRWLRERELGGQDLTAEVVEEFLQARRAAGCGQWLSLRGVAPVLEYLRDVGVARDCKNNGVTP